MIRYGFGRFWLLSDSIHEMNFSNWNFWIKLAHIVVKMWTLYTKWVGSLGHFVSRTKAVSDTEFRHTSGLSSDVIMKTSCDLWCQALEVMWTEGNVGQFFISHFTSVHSALMLFGCVYVYRFKLISFNWKLYIFFFIYLLSALDIIYFAASHTHSHISLTPHTHTQCTRRAQL